MANTARDLIKCSISNAPGTTGGFTLAAAAANSLMPGAGDDGLKFKLNITQNGVGTEIRKDCTYTHSSTSFSRGTMVRSTGTADAALNFTSAAIVRVVPSADDFYTSDPSGQLVVAIGDSLQGGGMGVAAMGFSTYNVSGLNWGCALLKQALWMPVGVTSAYSSGAPNLVNYCLAVSGTTTQDAIDDQVGPAQLLKAHWWSVQTGTNDLTLLAGSTVAQITARLRTICEAGLSSGARVALWTIVPCNSAAWTAVESTITGAGSTIAKQKLKHMAVNNWIRRYAQETPGVVLIDPYHELVDPASAAGEWLSAYTSDGTHCNGAGAFVAGQVFATAMRPFVKPVNLSSISQLDRYDATDNISGDFANSNGFQGGDGTNPPTGWTVGMQDGTATYTTATQARTDTVATGVPVNGRELQIAVSTASAASLLRAYQAATGTIIPANTPFYAEAEVSVSANSAAWCGPQLQMFFNDGTPAINSAGLYSDGSSLPVGALFDAVVRTPVMQSTAAAGGLIFTQMKMIASSAVTMKIRRISIRAIDPALPGLLLGAA
ncbi:MAG: SGNH/GDSL hydrolase family protein [Betaproteobacteria bacterium]|nr:SGNH/GDSL hydrolase family protein [Betaproteobacteria bacterium]